MKERTLPPWLLALPVAWLLIFSASLVWGQDEDDEEDMLFLSPFSVSSNLGITPGGSQDTNYFRSIFEMGEMPSGDAFTAEGLFSEHDLPLGGELDCESVVCINGEAVEAELLALPNVRYLAQIGFTSGLKEEEFKRPALNLVAVVDKSGSMHGQPLSLVRTALLEALKNMDEQDQLSIVLYGDTIDFHLPATRTTKGNKERIRTAIQEIQSYGSTYMEEGLRAGYAQARESAEAFEGATRLMLFTDERPNVGDTSAEGFMGQARAGSADGIGLTTIGVGDHFDPKLAAKISSVRGGNLFYYPTHEAMEDAFQNNFTFMVTEVANDMVIRISPAEGLRIAGLFGVPGDLLRWDGKSILLEIETLFLSRNKGAIYVALGPEESAEELEGVVATAELTYRLVGEESLNESTVALEPMPVDKAGLGLTRGVLLVNEYASIQKALRQMHEDKDTQAAYETIKALAALFSGTSDETLKREVDLISGLERTLAYRSGNRDSFPEGAPDALRDLIGTWEISYASIKGKQRKQYEWLFEDKEQYLIHVWPVGYAAIYNHTGSKKLFDLPLEFQGNELLLALDGEEVPFKVQKGRNVIVLRSRSVEARLKASSKKVQDPFPPEGSPRDPLSGLPE